MDHRQVRNQTCDFSCCLKDVSQSNPKGEEKRLPSKMPMRIDRRDQHLYQGAREEIIQEFERDVGSPSRTRRLCAGSAGCAKIICQISTELVSAHMKGARTMVDCRRGLWTAKDGEDAAHRRGYHVKYCANGAELEDQCRSREMRRAQSRLKASLSASTDET